MIKKLFYVIFIFSFASITWAEEYKVKRGDTLFDILHTKMGVTDLSNLHSKIRKVYRPFVLKTGMKIKIEDNKATIGINSEVDLIVEVKDNAVSHVHLKKHEVDVMNITVTGVIQTNLFDAIRKSGEDAELAAMIASIFEWEIDFFKDLRPGDKYAVLIEKRFINNKYAGYGKILAADFYNKNKRHRAIYYQNGKTRGYFTEKGRALERGFLRVPLNYARITSRFTSRRFHPVLKEVRPHYGVDYAAPIGTPVMATASGYVETIGYKRGNGKYIALRHSNGYKTYYLHLNGFNRRLRKGSPVNQGQIIGYVGSTGYSTGPHLDYRINRNGVWLNPLKFVATPKKLKKSEVPNFLIQAEGKSKILDEAFPVYAKALPYNDIRMLEF